MSSKCDGDRDMIYGGRHLDTGHCVLLSGLGWSLVLMTGTQILVIPLPQSLESTGRTPWNNGKEVPRWGGCCDTENESLNNW